MAIKISHDKNGRKIFSDSILYDEIANEYFIPVKVGSQWGDEFLGDFYPLKPSELRLIKSHGDMEDLQEMMDKNTEDAVFNIKGNIDL